MKFAKDDDERDERGVKLAPRSSYFIVLMHFMLYSVFPTPLPYSVFVTKSNLNPLILKKQRPIKSRQDERFSESSILSILDTATRQGPHDLFE